MLNETMIFFRFVYVFYVQILRICTGDPLSSVQGRIATPLHHYWRIRSELEGVQPYGEVGFSTCVIKRKTSKNSNILSKQLAVIDANNLIKKLRGVVLVKQISQSYNFLLLIYRDLNKK